MIKAVFFDLDGTLFDTAEIITRGFKHLFEKFRPDYHPTKEEYISFLGPALKDSFPRYFKESFDELLIEYRIATNHLLDNEHIKLTPGSDETIRELKKRGIKVAAVTSRQHKSAERMLDAFGYLSLFDYIVGCDDVSEVKPDPESFYKALDSLGLKSDEVIMVGDHINDIVGAKNAKVKAIGVDWDVTGANHLKEAGADFIINDMREILTLIKE